MDRLLRPAKGVEAFGLADPAGKRRILLRGKLLVDRAGILPLAKRREGLGLQKIDPRILRGKRMQGLQGIIGPACREKSAGKLAGDQRAVVRGEFQGKAFVQLLDAYLRNALIQCAQRLDIARITRRASRRPFARLRGAAKPAQKAQRMPPRRNAQNDGDVREVFNPIIIAHA